MNDRMDKECNGGQGWMDGGIKRDGQFGVHCDWWYGCMIRTGKISVGLNGVSQS